MDAEDGLIWVYGVGEDGVIAFTDFGIETLIELIRIAHQDPQRKPQPAQRSATRFACGLGRMGTLLLARTRDVRVITTVVASPGPRTGQRWRASLPPQPN